MHEPATSQHPLLITATAGLVRGVERTTGTVRWEVRVCKSTRPGAPNLHFAVELAIQDGLVLASAYGDNALFCIEYATGTVRWVADLGDIGRKAICVDGGQVFVGLNQTLRCFDLSGRLLWLSQGHASGAGVMALGFPGNLRQADQGE